MSIARSKSRSSAVDSGKAVGTLDGSASTREK